MKTDQFRPKRRQRRYIRNSRFSHCKSSLSHAGNSNPHQRRAGPGRADGASGAEKKTAGRQADRGLEEGLVLLCNWFAHRLDYAHAVAGRAENSQR